MGDVIPLFAPRERTHLAELEQAIVEAQEPVMRPTLKLLERVQLAIRNANRTYPPDPELLELAMRVFNDIDPYLPQSVALVQYSTLADIDRLPPNEELR